ncbi:MAG: TolC family protein, partial [Lentisphaerota bacterium]
LRAVAEPGGTQAATGPVYSLEQCLQIGLERAATMANARRDEKIAASKIRQVRAQVLPQLNVKSEYTRMDEVATIDFGQGPVEMGKLDNYSAEASASQLLYSGGAVQAALKAARIYRDRSKVSLDATEKNLRRDIRTGFSDILLAQANVNVQGEAVNQLSNFVAQTEAKYKNETASEFDLLSVRVRLANQIPILIKARRDVEVAKAAFRNLLHLDEESYELAGELGYQPATLSLDRLLQISVENRPEVDLQRKVVDLWIQDIRAERGGYLPSLRARASYAGQNPPASFSGEEEWDWGWNAGLTLDWSILDGGLRGGKVMEKALELEKSRENLRELERSVQLQVREAYLDMVHAAESVVASRDNVQLAEKNLEIARTRYQAGLSTYLEFTDTNLALSQARLIWYTALCSHTNALVRLQFACGLTETEFAGEMSHE